MIVALYSGDFWPIVLNDFPSELLSISNNLLSISLAVDQETFMEVLLFSAITFNHRTGSAMFSDATTKGEKSVNPERDEADGSEAL